MMHQCHSAAKGGVDSALELPSGCPVHLCRLCCWGRGRWRNSDKLSIAQHRHDGATHIHILNGTSWWYCRGGQKLFRAGWVADSDLECRRVLHSAHRHLKVDSDAEFDDVINLGADTEADVAPACWAILHTEQRRRPQQRIIM
jgi:hypothetical protein